MRILPRKSWGSVRTILIGVLAAAVLVFAVLALRPTDGLVAALVSRDPLPMGTKLEAANAQLVMVPAGVVPDDALTSTEDFVGSPTARYVPARSILTESDLIGSVRSQPLNAGEVLVNLSVPATVANDLLPGEVVDLWGKGATCAEYSCPPQLLAANARIVQVTASGASAWSPDNQTVISAILNEADIGAVLMAESDGSLNFILRSILDADYPIEPN